VTGDRPVQPPTCSPVLILIVLYLDVVNYTEMPGRTHPTMPPLLSAIDQVHTGVNPVPWTP